MWEFLSRADLGEVIGLVAVVGAFLTAVVAVLASQWRRVRVAEVEASLKQGMLDKGMSATEIEQVLRASSGAADDWEAGCPAEGAKSQTTALVEVMLANDMAAEDVERVLRALQGTSDGRAGERAAVVKLMVEHGLSAEEIERVLRAFDASPAGRVHVPEHAVRRL